MKVLPPVCLLLLSVLGAGCIVEEIEDDHVFVDVYGGRIDVRPQPGSPVLVGDPGVFRFMADDLPAVHVDLWSDGVWERYATIRDAALSAKRIEWNEAGNYTIYPDGGSAGAGVHANLTVLGLAEGCLPPMCHYYPAEEYFEHEHADGAMHYHRHDGPNETD